MKLNSSFILYTQTPYIIAELSANHNGSIECAFESILASKEVAVDTILSVPI